MSTEKAVSSVDFRAAAAALKAVPQLAEYKLIVHPLHALQARRGVSPWLSRGPLPRYAAELYEQTFADYHGWGINGYEA